MALLVCTSAYLCLCIVSAAAAASATGTATNTDMTGDDADRHWQEAVHELAALCRRNKRMQAAAQTALLPAELAASVDAASSRRRP